MQTKIFKIEITTAKSKTIGLRTNAALGPREG
jgi:hypothetical protein